MTRDGLSKREKAMRAEKILIMHSREEREKEKVDMFLILNT